MLSPLLSIKRMFPAGEGGPTACARDCGISIAPLTSYVGAMGTGIRIAIFTAALRFGNPPEPPRILTFQ